MVRRRTFWLAPAVLLLVTVVGVRAQGDERIAVEEFKRLVADNGVVILDVRNGEIDRKIKGALHMPYNDIEARAGELPRDREIVTQCKMGGRSAKAQEFLKSVGFSNVKNLKGGILAWIDRVDPTQPKY